LGSVIGQQAKPVVPRGFDPDSAGILDREPLEPVRNVRETLIEVLGPDVQRGCVNRADRTQLLKLRQRMGSRLEVIYTTLQARRVYDGGAKYVFWFILRRR